LTHVLVEQHPEEQRERDAAQELVGGVVLGDAEGRHTEMVPYGAPGAGTADLAETVQAVRSSEAAS
jgi:hypothetical protein